MRKTVWCVGALLVLLAPSAGSAQQVAVEFNPYGGLFLPVTNILELNSVARGEIASEVEEGLGDLGVIVSLDLDELTAKHKASFLFGGRLTVWVTDVFGVEGGFAYALSGANVDLAGTADGFEFDEADLIEAVRELGGSEAVAEVEQDLLEPDAYVWLASLKGLYRFVPQPGGIFAIHIGGGVALIGRGGDAFEEVGGTTDVGGVLNLGLPSTSPRRSPSDSTSRTTFTRLSSRMTPAESRSAIQRFRTTSSSRADWSSGSAEAELTQSRDGGAVVCRARFSLPVAASPHRPEPAPLFEWLLGIVAVLAAEASPHSGLGGIAWNH